MKIVPIIVLPLFLAAKSVATTPHPPHVWLPDYHFDIELVEDQFTHIIFNEITGTNFTILFDIDPINENEVPYLDKVLQVELLGPNCPCVGQPPEYPTVDALHLSIAAEDEDPKPAPLTRDDADLAILTVSIDPDEIEDALGYYEVDPLDPSKATISFCARVMYSLVQDLGAPTPGDGDPDPSPAAKPTVMMYTDVHVTLKVDLKEHFCLSIDALKAWNNNGDIVFDAHLRFPLRAYLCDADLKELPSEDSGILVPFNLPLPFNQPLFVLNDKLEQGSFIRVCVELEDGPMFLDEIWEMKITQLPGWTPEFSPIKNKGQYVTILTEQERGNENKLSVQTHLPAYMFDKMCRATQNGDYYLKWTRIQEVEDNDCDTYKEEPCNWNDYPEDTPDHLMPFCHKKIYCRVCPLQICGTGLLGWGEPDPDRNLRYLEDSDSVQDFNFLIAPAAPITGVGPAPVDVVPVQVPPPPPTPVVPDPAPVVPAPAPAPTPKKPLSKKARKKAAKEAKEAKIKAEKKAEKKKKKAKKAKKAAKAKKPGTRGGNKKGNNGK